MTRITRIDWFSYTKPNDVPLFEVEPLLEGLSRDFVRDWVGFWASAMPHPNEWNAVTPNKPFRRAIQCPGSLVRMEWGGGSNSVLVMLPGRACEFADKAGLLNTLVYRHAGDCSRIDFAVDMWCTVRPADFVNARTNKRHKNISFMTSEEGETCYVGSWSSDRFARVYRYNPPHERANWLRAEHVFRGKQAKAFAYAIQKHGHASALAFCGDVYGWGDNSWVNEPSSKQILDVFKAWIPERHVSKTLKWLEETCIPALLRLAAEGEIDDVYEWFEQQVALQMDNGRDKMGVTPDRQVE